MSFCFATRSHCVTKPALELDRDHPVSVSTLKLQACTGAVILTFGSLYHFPSSQVKLCLVSFGQIGCEQEMQSVGSRASLCLPLCLESAGGERSGDPGAK